MFPNVSYVCRTVRNVGEFIPTSCMGDGAGAVCLRLRCEVDQPSWGIRGTRGTRGGENVFIEML